MLWPDDSDSVRTPYLYLIKPSYSSSCTPALHKITVQIKHTLEFGVVVLIIPYNTIKVAIPFISLSPFLSFNTLTIPKITIQKCAHQPSSSASSSSAPRPPCRPMQPWTTRPWKLGNVCAPPSPPAPYLAHAPPACCAATYKKTASNGATKLAGNRIRAVGSSSVLSVEDMEHFACLGYHKNATGDVALVD